MKRFLKVIKANIRTLILSIMVAVCLNVIISSETVKHRVVTVNKLPSIYPSVNYGEFEAYRQDVKDDREWLEGQIETLEKMDKGK